ncbi:uncharacterized protein [Amphiura filiformis]|uniref:uncharacterized protein n=1 Tax=Amphiura filiformis TaxID=82378 RepID=UPI003B211CF9
MENSLKENGYQQITHIIMCSKDAEIGGDMHTGVLNAIVIGACEDILALKSAITCMTTYQVTKMIIKEASLKGEWIFDSYNATGEVAKVAIAMERNCVVLESDVLKASALAAMLTNKGEKLVEEQASEEDLEEEQASKEDTGEDQAGDITKSSEHEKTLDSVADKTPDQGKTLPGTSSVESLNSVADTTPDQGKTLPGTSSVESLNSVADTTPDQGKTLPGTSNVESLDSVADTTPDQGKTLPGTSSVESLNSVEDSTPDQDTALQPTNESEKHHT